MTIERLLDEADDIQRRALAKGEYHAAVNALIAKAKLAGLWVDLAKMDQQTKAVYEVSDRPLTPEEWSAKYCESGLS